jgi:hypothetical protein
MPEENKKENSLIPINSTGLIQSRNLIALTNKLLFGDIESLFNEAFYLLNNKDINLNK